MLKLAPGLEEVLHMVHDSIVAAAAIGGVVVIVSKPTPGSCLRTRKVGVVSKLTLGKQGRWGVMTGDETPTPSSHLQECMTLLQGLSYAKECSDK